MRTCLKSAHRRRIARSLTSRDEHGSPRYKPRSGSCCVFPPTKGTPVQAILPDRDGFALSYGDSCDEFPPRWQTATLLERATTLLRNARAVFRPTHVADAAISRPPAPARVAA